MVHCLHWYEHYLVLRCAADLVSQKDHRYEIYVHLKLEMRIVLQANLEPSSGLVNGTQGTIIDFEPFDEKRLPRKAENKMEAAPSGVSFTRGTYARYNEEQIKLFGKENKRQPWPVVRFDNGSTRTIFADCTVSEFGNEEPFSLLSRTQIPLMAGYAVTVHKSQVCSSLPCRMYETNVKPGHDTRSSHRRPFPGLRTQSNLCGAYVSLLYL